LNLLLNRNEAKRHVCLAKLNIAHKSRLLLVNTTIVNRLVLYETLDRCISVVAIAVRFSGFDVLGFLAYAATQFVG
jgi:hypothetical protein